jgi:P-type E1-E2 ATPase
LARYTFEDVARSGAAQLVSHLRHRGYNLAILSGDHQNVVTEFAAKIGIEAKNARGDMTAFEKEAVLAKTANSVMIGDGMNDGLALSKANVGILTGEVDSRLNADIFIRDQVMPNLEYLILFSRHTFNVLDQNIAFSAIYNSIGLVHGLGIAFTRCCFNAFECGVCVFKRGDSNSLFTQI